jgi:DNA-binding response OmpR family regulator
MRKRVLVVDDEEHIRRVMRMTLEAAGYEVGEAPDGLRGLEAFGDGSAWDAILLDQRMPGIDGLETLRRMKERRADARVVMITAYASIELAVDAMKLGALDFVRKPTTPEMVRNAVTAVLARPTPEATVPSAPPPGQAPERPRVPVARLTLNGFRLWRAPGGGKSADPSTRQFVVQHPDGREQDILVHIAAPLVQSIQRATGRPLPLESSFWTWRAERALNNYLWNEGKVPPAGLLTLTKVEPDDLQVARQWEEDRV